MIITNKNSTRIMASAFFYLIIILLVSNELILFKYLKFSLVNDYSPYPIYNFLTGNGRFDDFIGAFHREMPSSHINFIISPLMIFLTNASKAIQSLAHTVFLSLSFILWIHGTYKITKNMTLTMLIVFTYPMWFAFFRSNSEYLAVALLLNSFAYLFFSVRNRLSQKLSLIFLLLAISIKPTTILFLVLFPLDIIRKNKAFIIFFVLLNFTAIVCNKLNIIDYAFEYYGSLRLYKLEHIIGSGGTLFNNSFYGLFKSFYLLWFNQCADSECYSSGIRDLTAIYSYISSALIIALCICSYFVRSTILKVGILCVTISFLPNISADYRLLYLIVYLIFIFSDIEDVISSKSKLLYLITVILIVLIISPKHYIYFGIFRSYGESFTLQSILNPLLGFALFIILFLLIYRDFVNKRF